MNSRILSKVIGANIMVILSAGAYSAMALPSAAPTTNTNARQTMEKNNIGCHTDCIKYLRHGNQLKMVVLDTQGKIYTIRRVRMPKNAELGSFSVNTLQSPRSPVQVHANAAGTVSTDTSTATYQIDNGDGDGTTTIVTVTTTLTYLQRPGQAKKLIDVDVSTSRTTVPTNPGQGGDSGG